MTNPIPFDFHGDTLLLVEVDGRPHVVLKHALDLIGVDYWGQIERLRRRSWATTRKTRVVAEDGKTREMVTVDARTFGMLLATIDENRVAADVRPRLVAYQAEVADVIEAYWTKGGAINPRATPDQLELLRGQASVLAALAPIVEPKWLEAKGRHIAARAMGEEPEVDPLDTPLSVGEYLVQRGVQGKDLRSVSPPFGKKVKALYVALHGEEPKPVPRFVDGAMRSVAGYTNADRHLFDSVWSDHYAARFESPRLGV
jgi:antirepressor protein